MVAADAGMATTKVGGAAGGTARPTQAVRRKVISK
jgi:hypothetical protein